MMLTIKTLCELPSVAGWSGSGISLPSLLLTRAENDKIICEIHRQFKSGGFRRRAGPLSSSARSQQLRGATVGGRPR